MPAKVHRLLILGALAVAGLALTGLTITSSAFAEAPWWVAHSGFRPSALVPGHEGQVVVTASNFGDLPVSGENSPVTFTDVLPAGVVATSIASTNAGELNRGEIACPTSFPATSVTCTWSGSAPFEVTPAKAEPLQPYEQLEVVINIDTESTVSSDHEENEVKVSGGEGYSCHEVEAGTGKFSGAFCELAEESGGDYEGEPTGRAVPPVSQRRPVAVGNGTTPFGLEDYQLALENEDGTPDTQAGSHPFQMTTTVALNQGINPEKPPALAKDLHFNLPAGLIGDPIPFAQCTEAEYSTIVGESADLCPADSAVGVASVTFVLQDGSPVTITVPVFNLVPAPGEPARFGFELKRTAVTIDVGVRTGRDYGIVVNVDNITEVDALLSARVTLWGVPGEAVHDKSRGWSCVAGGNAGAGLAPCTALGEAQTPPFLSLPTSCSGPLETSVEADSWTAPANKLTYEPSEPMESLDGCGALPFSASIETTPDVKSASTPTGMTVDVHVPQEASLNPTGLMGSDVKDITVALPEGVTVNPAGANGLEACSEAEIGYLPGESEPPGKLIFTSGLPAPKEATPEPFCPDASKIGTAKITLPIIAHPLEGAVYLASQNANPFGSLLAIYVVAEDPVSGVLVKLPGEVSLNQETGQITTTFLNNPQAPFENAEFHFFGGERAPFSTPTHCGTYTTNASFTPWSGNEPVNSKASFQITPNGGSCPGLSLPFAPSLTAQTTNIQAGAFSPLTTTISREDGQQNIQAVQLHMPAGLSGVLTGVKLCGEAEADAGTCGAESLIGSTIVSVGLGGDPYTVTGGKVYLTGPYEGAPFGLSIVNQAVAGPFNLGKVVVRAKVEVNPTTAALTITTDDSGAHKIPSILDGIPLQIKHVNVAIERPGFTFNPTDCNHTQITGSVSSVEGAGSAVAVPFQVTNCERLAFKPKFTASTSGKTSKTDGANLSVKIAYPNTPQGTEANIAKVKVDLPKQLPSRLTTLQKACLARVFEANPANCPKDSEVGHAKAITPILPVPLEGPAYFVSHGGEAFPSLIIVLKGYGVTVDLVGTTFISKAGITSSTFKSVPDVPVSSFELTLPEGKYSALGTNKNLCTQKLAMPTAFVAQNGAEIHDSTPIGVTGCTKAKKAKKSTKKKGKHKAGKSAQGKKQ
jgi:hypothetical protein